MASSSPNLPSTRDWAGLQLDVLLSIFVRAGQAEILQSAGLACAPWWRVARHDSTLWRHIDLTMPDEDEDEESSDDDCIFSLFDDHITPVYTHVVEEVPRSEKDRLRDQKMKRQWKAFALAAIDRSAGQCQAFRGRADDEVLQYLADRAQSLKSLSVTSHYDMSSEAFSELITKFPLLEELEVELKSDSVGYTSKYHKEPGTNSWAELLQSASKACQHLRRFSVHHAGRVWFDDSYYQRDPKSDNKPFSIQTMCDLRSLELFGDSFTKVMVLHIVENCPSLESLDITNVPHMFEYVEELRNKCSRIKDVRIQTQDSESEDGDCCCCGMF